MIVFYNKTCYGSVMEIRPYKVSPTLFIYFSTLTLYSILYQNEFRHDTPQMVNGRLLIDKMEY